MFGEGDEESSRTRRTIVGISTLEKTRELILQAQPPQIDAAQARATVCQAAALGWRNNDPSAWARPYTGKGNHREASLLQMISDILQYRNWLFPP
jgi:hypothetical protein